MYKETVWSFDTEVGVFEFRWNQAHTVNVYLAGENIDVFTVGSFDKDSVDESQVVDAIVEWLTELEIPVSDDDIALLKTAGSWWEDYNIGPPEVERIQDLISPYIDYSRRYFYRFTVPADVANEILSMMPPGARRERQNYSPTAEDMVHAAVEGDGFVEGYLSIETAARVGIEGVHIPASDVEALVSKARRKPDEVDDSPLRSGYVRLWWD